MHEHKKTILPAIGLSMIAGAALGMALTPKKDINKMKHTAEKTLRAVGHTMGEAVDNFTDAMM